MMATAFLGYVLPYGQMSLWGATVITNLLSAIPFFGQDLVESNYNFITEILTIFGNNKLNLENNILPTIGLISRQALLKRRNLRIDKQRYLLIPFEFISFLIGLIDGDGYIQITKTTKGFIAIKLIIALNLKDLSTLQYIHSVLNLGKIQIYKDNISPTCKLIINKTDLQEVLFPLLIHYNIFFLTNTRRNQFDLAMYIFKNDLKLFENISKISDIQSLFELPENPSDYLQLKFFKNWLVGFTNAEGSFLIKENNDGCFQLKQRIHIKLFEAFKLLFNTQRKFVLEKDKYLQFSVSSKADIQKIIYFFSFSGLHPLIGQKNIQYFKWLNDLKFSYRYQNLNFPNN
jgi:hypothetical protein